MSAQNPFEKWDLDPFEGPEGITEKLRELVEDADAATTDELRADWEALTLHPRRRVELALQAHPETRPALGRKPRPASKRRPQVELELVDLVALPTVASALGEPIDLHRLPDHSLEDDPIFRTAPTSIAEKRET